MSENILHKITSEFARKSCDCVLLLKLHTPSINVQFYFQTVFISLLMLYRVDNVSLIVEVCNFKI